MTFSHFALLYHPSLTPVFCIYLSLRATHAMPTSCSIYITILLFHVSSDVMELEHQLSHPHFPSVLYKSALPKGPIIRHSPQPSRNNIISELLVGRNAALPHKDTCTKMLLWEKLYTLYMNNGMHIILNCLPLYSLTFVPLIYCFK